MWLQSCVFLMRQEELEQRRGCFQKVLKPNFFLPPPLFSSFSSFTFHSFSLFCSSQQPALIGPICPHPPLFHHSTGSASAAEAALVYFSRTRTLDGKINLLLSIDDDRQWGGRPLMFESAAHKDVAGDIWKYIKKFLFGKTDYYLALSLVSFVSVLYRHAHKVRKNAKEHISRLASFYFLLSKCGQGITEWRIKLIFPYN